MFHHCAHEARRKAKVPASYATSAPTLNFFFYSFSSSLLFETLLLVMLSSSGVEGSPLTGAKPPPSI